MLILITPITLTLEVKDTGKGKNQTNNKMKLNIFLLWLFKSPGDINRDNITNKQSTIADKILNQNGVLF